MMPERSSKSMLGFCKRSRWFGRKVSQEIFAHAVVLGGTCPEIMQRTKRSFLVHRTISSEEVCEILQKGKAGAKRAEW